MYPSPPPSPNFFLFPTHHSRTSPQSHLPLTYSRRTVGIHDIILFFFFRLRKCGFRKIVSINRVKRFVHRCRFVRNCGPLRPAWDDFSLPDIDIDDTLQGTCPCDIDLSSMERSPSSFLTSVGNQCTTEPASPGYRVNRNPRPQNGGRHR